MTILTFAFFFVVGHFLKQATFGEVWNGEDDASATAESTDGDASVTTGTPGDASATTGTPEVAVDAEDAAASTIGLLQ